MLVRDKANNSYALEISVCVCVCVCVCLGFILFVPSPTKLFKADDSV